MPQSTTIEAVKVPEGLPWTACRDGECQCMTISDDHGPVAEVTCGKWGDTYPALRIVDGELSQHAEPYIEMIEYGEISKQLATDRARYIVASANAYPQLIEENKKLREGFKALIRAVQVNGKLVGYHSDILDAARAAYKSATDGQTMDFDAE